MHVRTYTYTYVTRLRARLMRGRRIRSFALAMTLATTHATSPGRGSFGGGGRGCSFIDIPPISTPGQFSPLRIHPVYMNPAKRAMIPEKSGLLIITYVRSVALIFNRIQSRKWMFSLKVADVRIIKSSLTRYRTATEFIA